MPSVIFDFSRDLLNTSQQVLMLIHDCVHSQRSEELRAGFKLVKQNQFTKISERSEKKDLPQVKKFLDLQIIL